ncbi:MAG: hypothetical protein QW791_01450 [Candidatus Bathyarchaeia archaeon]
MRRDLATCGLILIVLGLVFFSIYNLPGGTEVTYCYKEIVNDLVDKEAYAWKISWDEMIFEWEFLIGEGMSIAVWPNYDWGVPSLAEEPTAMELPPGSGQWFQDVKRLRVNVTNIDNGNSTVIEIYYVYVKPSFPYIFQDYFGVMTNTGALNLENIYPKAGVIDGKGVIHLGKVKINGIYKVTFSMEPLDVMDAKIIDNRTVPWPHPISPPNRVRLYKSKEVTIHPYRSPHLLFAGATIIALGGTIFLKNKIKPSKHNFRKLKNSRHQQ